MVIFKNLLKDSKTRANLLFNSGVICGMEPKRCKCQTKNLKTRSCFARWEPKINGFRLSNSQKSMWIKYEPKSFQPSRLDTSCELLAKYEVIRAKTLLNRNEKPQKLSFLDTYEAYSTINSTWKTSWRPDAVNFEFCAKSF